MKPQQRSFVVEYKSSRRRLDNQPTSIWGNMDLKAIAEKASEDAPRLFSPEVGVDDLIGQKQGNTSENTFSSPADTGEEVERALPAADVIEEVIDAPELLDATPPIPIEDPEPTERAQVKRKVAVRRKAAKPVSFQEGTPPTIVIQEATVDELALLEIENLQLKAQLAQRLLSQNFSLKGMLERFER